MELLLALWPIRHDATHERMEPRSVIRLKKMTQLVYDHIFETLRGIERESDVEADAACFRLAASPTALHIAIIDLSGMYVEDLRPLFDQRRDACFHDLAPRFDLFFACGLRTS